MFMFPFTNRLYLGTWEPKTRTSAGLSFQELLVSGSLFAGAALLQTVGRPGLGDYLGEAGGREAARLRLGPVDGRWGD